MRIISALLIVCMLFISSLQGVASATSATMKDCCKKSAAACKHKPAEKKHTGCEQPACAMMFSCSLCGFLVEEVLTVPPAGSAYLPKPVAPHHTDAPADYHPDNWKPPKWC